MSWLVRFAAYATALAIPAWWAMDAYQSALASAVAAALALLGRQVDVVTAQTTSPMDLAVFAALCLASRRAPARERRRALLLGLPLTIAVEIVATALGILVVLPFLGGGASETRAFRMLDNVIETIPWVGAVLVWFALLGRWELPAHAIAALSGSSRVGSRPRRRVDSTLDRDRGQEARVPHA